MLTEEEWGQVAPLLTNAIAQIKRYREEHHCTLAEANAKGFGLAALAEYQRITGFAETNPNALYHHRLNLFGPPCKVCGKSLRTPIARSCAECGHPRQLAKYDAGQNRFEA